MDFLLSYNLDFDGENISNALYDPEPLLLCGLYINPENLDLSYVRTSASMLAVIISIYSNRPTVHCWKETEKRVS